MPDPTFNGQKCFSSPVPGMGGGGTTYLTEGVLWVPDYGQITQKIHFNGETGDRTLFHGYADMEWKFEGVISADNLTDLLSALNTIEINIKQNTSDFSTYYTLVDSFGTVYDCAQIRHLTKRLIHATDNGYVAQVVVTGVIAGNALDGATT